MHRSAGRKVTINKRWKRFWMRRSGYTGFARMATWLATLFSPPHYLREELAHLSKRGYIASTTTVHHSDLRLGENIFVDDRCLIFQNNNGGYVELGNKVRIYRDTIIETGEGGFISIGQQTSIHPRCQLNAYLSPIRIGKWVMIAANCALFSYDHDMLPNKPIREQPITSKGEIFIDDEAWIGTGVIILSGVRIGKGAVVGAGSVVTKSIPDGAIAVGNPAKVVKMRSD